MLILLVVFTCSKTLSYLKQIHVKHPGIYNVQTYGLSCTDVPVKGRCTLDRSLVHRLVYDTLATYGLFVNIWYNISFVNPDVNKEVVNQLAIKSFGNSLSE